MSDIKATPATEHEAIVISEKKPLPVQPPPTTTTHFEPASSSNLDQAVRDSLRRRFHHYSFSISMMIVLPFALWSWYLLKPSHNNLNLPLPNHNPLLFTTISALYLLLAYAVGVISVSALIFATSKQADHRSANSDDYQTASWAAFWPSFGVDLLFIGWVSGSTIVWQLLRLALLSLNLGQAVNLGVTAGLVMVGLALLAALTSARIFAQYAMVLGGLEPMKAWMSGWQLTKHRLAEAFGFQAVSLSMSLLVVGLYVYGTWWVLHWSRLKPFTPAQYLMPLIVLLVGVYIVSALFEFNVSYFLRSYRAQVGKVFNANASRYLVARPGGRRPTSAIVAVSLLLLSFVSLVGLSLR